VIGSAPLHGAAVASIAVGKAVGVAPDGDMYHIGSSLGFPGMPTDFRNDALGVRPLLKINDQLPADRKIRVIAIQIGWDRSQWASKRHRPPARRPEPPGCSSCCPASIRSTDSTENTLNQTTFCLADLSSFGASIGTGQSVVTLSLDIKAVQGNGQGTWPGEFSVSSLGSGGASTSFVILGLSFFQTRGAATITSVASVPEPSSVTLALLGLLLVGRGWVGRRKASAIA
jgi:hypothetical protein